jgi:uncharacterized protein (DUF2141 family)
MNWKKILVVLLVAVTILALGGCKDTGSPVGGTVTITLTGAGDADDGVFNAGVFVSLDSLSVDDIPLDGISEVISSGSASGVTNTIPAGTYQLGAFIDLNDNGDPDPGDYLFSGEVFTVNGNTSVTVNFEDFEPVIGSIDDLIVS